MAVTKLIQEARGSWEGKSLLHLSYLPPEQQVSESSTTLKIETDDNQTFATITYTWSHEGKPHQGTFLLSQSDETNRVDLAWVDSWHQNTGIMNLVGEESSNGSVETKGGFAAGDETWGWTISFAQEATEFKIEMAVIPPGEEPQWAVKATYTKV